MRSQIHSDTPRMPRRQPRVVRWLLLCLLSWMATFVVFLVSTEGAIAAHLLGGNGVSITHTARVQLTSGEPFGLVSGHDSPVHCHVAPESATPRTLVASSSSNSFRLHNPRPPRTEYSWFTGGAEVRCSAPTTYLPPERYDNTAERVTTALATLSGALLIVVAAQGVRRWRCQVR